MQLSKVLILSLFSLSLTANVFAARWDGATVDMSGSNNTGSTNICDQPRPFDSGKALFWDSMCGQNQPQDDSSLILIPQDPTYPADPYEDDSDRFWNDWEKEMQKVWEDDTTQQDIQEKQKRKEWSSQTATQMVNIWVYAYNQPDGLRSGYLNPEMMADLADNRYMFDDILNSCLTTKIYNDFDNITNLIDSGKHDRASHWMAGMLSDCYYQVRGF